MHTSICRHPLSIALALSIAGGITNASAVTVDGVVLITQDAAVKGKITPGDAAGFPVTIDRAGSYRLASNLTVPDADTTAILITADDVVLDLGGFTIAGPVDCSGPPIVCTASGIGDGIRVQSGTITGTVIKNGSVRGMGRYGIAVNRGQIDNVRVGSNAGRGIFAADATITNCNVIANAFEGIFASGLVSNNRIQLNGGLGLTSTTTGSFGYGNNLFELNNGTATGPQVENGIQLAPNICNFVPCP